MPNDTMAVDMTARARMPGTKKSTGVSPGVDTTCTEEKNSKKTTGMPTVSNSVSPRRSVMNTSAQVWAASALTSGLPVAGPARRGAGGVRPVPRPAGSPVPPHRNRPLRGCALSTRSLSAALRSANQVANAAVVAGPDTPVTR